MLASHQMKSLRNFKQCMIGKIHTVHHTIQCFTSIYAILPLDVLTVFPYLYILYFILWSAKIKKLILITKILSKKVIAINVFLTNSLFWYTLLGIVQSRLT